MESSEKINEGTCQKIKLINKTVVNQICSGQVVLTLATAVKELLENSLDAGAKSIQIKLVEYGSQQIEVIDNGSGVDQSNFDGLTLKHHTSKISGFQDLETVSTFGFRGEALSSLCTLADVTIITRSDDSPTGSRLSFDHNGKTTKSTSLARQIGTTVVVDNLFYTLPVRQKEFLRNVKKEFGKLCTVLQAYSLLNEHCSISCCNRVGSKTRSVLDVKSGTLKERIVNIFGNKVFSNLVELKTVAPNEEILSEFKCSDGGGIQLTGYISSCAHGAGASSPDRQFFYINGRPVDNNKLIRLVNEVYRQFSPHMYPFAVVKIVTTGSVDVNIVPDKRQIMLEDENLLLAYVKMSLLEIFKTIPSTIPKNLGLGQKYFAPVQSASVEGLKRFLAPREKRVEGSDSNAVAPKKCVPCSPPSLRRFFDVVEYPIVKRQKMDSGQASPEAGKITQVAQVERNSPMEVEIAELEQNSVVEEVDSGTQDNFENSGTCRNSLEFHIDEGLSESEKSSRKQVSLPVSIEQVKKSRLLNLTTNSVSRQVKFFAKIEPVANKQAEDELKKELSQEAFTKMEVLGQFNKGFIIARLDDDLFIIDQHASDEKANFEMLSQKKIHQQRLAVPQQLHLCVDKEELLLEKAEIVRAGGFEFSFDEDAPVTKRVSLTSVPIFRGTVLDRNHLDELLFILSEAPPGQHYRASRMREILASRACRMSVMIGTVMTRTEMRQLLHRMSTLEQPWNCPHGRPTIRHLINLNLIQMSD